MFRTVSKDGASKPSSACKFVLVTGGVISGVGKGIIASSTGVLLQSLGERVTSIKIDPYLNIDAGTLSPYDHGEVFILGDGGEVDLDLGNYERFLNVTLTRDHNITTGKIYRDVIEKERRGDYLGKTVQVIPHITNHIQDWIERVSKIPVDASGLPPTTCVIELGGTVGDIESAPFVEALRQFQFRVGLENFMLIHVSLVPVVGSVGEQKTKPTQNSVRDLRSSGLTPDVVACRSTGPLEAAIVEKIAMFTHVPQTCVYSVHDCESVYHVPMLLEQQGLRKLLAQRLQLQRCGDANASEDAAAASSHSIRRLQLSPERPRKVKTGQVPDGTSAEVGAGREELYTREYRRWKQLAGNLLTAASTTRLTVAIVGKYTYLEDSYISVAKALAHAAMAQCVDCKVLWIEASDLEEPGAEQALGEEGQADATGHLPPPPPAAPAAGAAGTGTTTLTAAEKHAAAWSKLRSAAGVIVPGGFGVRGTEGKIAALRYCREQKVPLLGICLGFQLAVVEHARNLLGMEGANSTEMAPNTAHPVVVFMPEGSRTHMGGTMRLGARESYFVQGTTVENSHARRLYTAAKVASDCAGNIGSKSPVQAEDMAAAAVDCIVERHRHRYEVNPELVPQLETHGMRFVARDAPGAAGERMEILERSDHPYFLAVQYHPEFLSRLIHPSPPFSGLVEAAVTYAATCAAATAATAASTA